jgi:hypothetical protein
MSLVAQVDVFDESHSLVLSGAHCSISANVGIRQGVRRVVWHGVLDHPGLAEKIAQSLPARLWLVALNWERTVRPTEQPTTSYAMAFDGEGEPPPGMAQP